jgi:hypothetical protein
MTLARPSAAAGRYFGLSLVAAAVIALPAMVANPMTAVRTELWAGLIVPIVLGAIVCLLATYRYFVPGAIDVSLDSPPSGTRAIGRGVMAAMMVFAFSSFAAREALLVIGATARGTEQLVGAIVDDVHRTSGGKNRCMEFATFRLEGGERREICVESRYRDSIPKSQISVDDAVILIVSNNVVGSWVTAVRSTSDSPPNKSLERTRER